MKITYRTGKKEDSHKIAELDYVASSGACEYLFHDLVPGMSPIQIITQGLERDNYPHSYQSAIVAEYEGRVIGMAFSFPAKFHCINDEMRNFIPADRLEHFKDFFTSRVEGSYFLDAIGVEEKFRSNGIGHQLLQYTIDKARQEGYSSLSLIVFADNEKAIQFYTRHGFETIKAINLEANDIIQHRDGCLLMNRNF